MTTKLTKMKCNSVSYLYNALRLLNLRTKSNGEDHEQKWGFALDHSDIDSVYSILVEVGIMSQGMVVCLGAKRDSKIDTQCIVRMKKDGSYYVRIEYSNDGDMLLHIKLPIHSNKTLLALIKAAYDRGMSIYDVLRNVYSVYSV